MEVNDLQVTQIESGTNNSVKKTDEPLGLEQGHENDSGIAMLEDPSLSHSVAELPPKILEPEISTEPESQSGNEDLEQYEEDFTIFHCVSYLGAASIREPRSQPEIHRVMAFLNEQPVDKLIQVSVSVPLHSDGSVIVYEEENQLEISRFGVNQLIFFARGLAGTPDWICFAFTCSHGGTVEDAIFQCHVFRCDVPEAVGRVFATFARTFTSQSRSGSRQSSKASLPPTVSIPGDRPSISSESSDVNTTDVLFEVSLELKEDDGKGNFNSVPRDKGFFKLRSCVPKHIVLTVQQLPHFHQELIVERCFGLLLSPGRRVRHSDMQLVEMLSWSIGSQGQGLKTYVITGQWDANDPAFESLNHETPKESHVFFTVAVDLVIKGIQEPIRFALETQAKIYPATERFWILVRKYHFTQQFLLSLQQIEDSKSGDILYKVISNLHKGEVDRSRANYNLSFTSFIRTTSMELESPKDEDPDSDDDEPLQSGMGEISKHCTDEQLASWSELVANWLPTTTTRPKQISTLVQNGGIPDTLRGEIWLRLSGSHHQDDTEMMNTYRKLLTMDCPNEEIILRDIHRTFPANDYFRESGGTGQEQLYKISKAYAVFDTEVGYCQGISFIAAALLLQMPEEQAFCLLVRIMYNYEFRNLFLERFENLRLKLYQLDRLVEDQIPELWAHFQELGIESHMYANQWFLTLYTAKFPLIFVFRVLDSFLLDGSKVLFQVGLSLLAAARKDLLMLDFEGILKFFRITLPKKYRNPEITTQQIRNAHGTKVKKLKRYEAEYLARKEQERNYVDPLEQALKEKKHLMLDVLRLEHLVTNLVLGKVSAEESLAHVEEELAKTKTTLREVEEFNQKLKEETNSVKELFQREVKIYDAEAEKKTTIIAEYKRICTNLGSALEGEQKKSRERSSFFQSNLCENCASFVATALQIAGNKERANGDMIQGPSTLGSSSSSSVGGGMVSPPSPPEDPLKPLENELANTKIALAEAECRSEDLSHQLSLAQAELEICRSTHGLSGPSRIWKNLTGGKESKRSSLSIVEDANNSGNSAMSSSMSLQSFAKKSSLQ